jgi:Protein of unknown function (DUF3168)
MQYAVEKGLNTFLLATAALTALVNTRIANDFANQLTRPYVLFALNAGMDTNLQKRNQGDFRYGIQGMADSLKAAADIAQVLRTALHDKTFTVDAPWKIDLVQHTTAISYVEMVDDVQIYHRGGIYRIRVSEEF